MNVSTVDELLEEAASLVEQYEFQQAVNKFHEAHQLEPENTIVLDNLAEVLLELGQVDDAQHLLERSIELKPDEGFSKYMNLGQITAGLEAVTAFRKGIELVKKELKQKAGRGNAKLIGLKKKLSSALVSISEIYMTDLCDEEDAEDVCGSSLEEAISVDPQNWETLQAIASYRISQQNNESALLHLQQSYALWKDLEPEDIDRPSHDARVATSKLFVELEAYTEAAEVLESLLEDDDSNAETWYLTAFCYAHTDVESAPEYIDRAKTLLRKQNITDPGILKQVDDLSHTVSEKLQNIAPESNGNE